MNGDTIAALLSRTIGKAVNTPRLAATPSARVGVTLGCALGEDSTGGSVIIDDVER
jgi:hypothetical protein